MKLLSRIAVLATLCACNAKPELEPEQGTPHQLLGEAPRALLERPQVEAVLASTGVLQVSQLKDLVLLSSDALGQVYATPGLPSTTSPVELIFIESTSLQEPIASGTARFTVDAWAHSRDVAGLPFVGDGARGLHFTLPPTGQTARLEAAISLQMGTAALWLNNQARNYVLHVCDETPLEWVGGLSAHQEGLGRRLNSELPLYAGHPLTVEVQTYPQTPNTAPVLHWKHDGKKSSSPMSLTALNEGDHGNNARWSVTVPALVQGAMELWVEAKGPLNTLWDSRDGTNHRASVVTPPVVEWSELGAYLFNKCHYVNGQCQTGWFYGPGLADPFLATPSEYEVYAAAPSIATDIFVPGVTDQGGPVTADPSFVRAEIFSPFFSGSPTAAWTSYPLHFVERVGNNWRFKWDVRAFSVPGMPAIGVSCPQNGDYPYKVRTSTDNGETWRWMGIDGRDRTFHWEGLTREMAPLSVAGETRFGEVTMGNHEAHVVELVNTQNESVRVSSVSLEDATGSFDVSAPCDLTSCNTVLQAGGRLPLQLTFAPTTVGNATARIQIGLAPTQALTCSNNAGFGLALEGTGT
ncbi:MAG: hypothetical protein ACT4TC_15615 [Myxococcaceae bacterium]